jgi:hypothetical protein
MVAVTLRKRIERVNECLFMTISLLVLCILTMLVIYAATPSAIRHIAGQILSPIHRENGIEGVSGLYGPGAYSAWVFCTTSAIIGSAVKTGSSKLSPDQIASFLYSTFSMYWYHIRCSWYQQQSSELVQDYSVQAASFVFNISTLFHSLGCIFSTEENNGAWILFLIWDTWILWACPMAFLNGTSEAIHMLIIPIVFMLIFYLKANIRPRPWKLVPFLLLPFGLLEVVRCQFSSTWIFVIPKTGSSLTDLDQLVSLVTAIVVTVYEWRLWDLQGVARKIRKGLQRTPTRSNSTQLEASVAED